MEIESDKYIQHKIAKIRENIDDIFYNDHFIVRYTDLGRLKLIEAYNPQRPGLYNYKFIFDSHDSSLYIDGDYGQACVKFYASSNTFWDLTNYARVIGYFSEKITERKLVHIYDKKLAKMQLRETAEQQFADADDKTLTGMHERLESFLENVEFDNEDRITDDSLNAYYEDVLKTDWIDDPPDYGGIINPRVVCWCRALTNLSKCTTTFIPKNVN